MSETFDVVIVGGAVVGSATAYHLLSDPAFTGRVLVVERDPSYARAASSLSLSSVRLQYSQPVNIAASAYGVTFLREADTRLAIDGDTPGIVLHETGYLYLATAAGEAQLRANHGVQRAADAPIVLLGCDALSARFPWLATDDLALGALGLEGEGWFDGYALTQGLRRKARALGAQYRAARAVDLVREGSRITTVTFDDGSQVGCGHIVNAAGASGARALSGLMGFDVPVFAKKRCVFAFDAPTTLPDCPLVIDPGGVYFRADAGGFLTGWSPDDLDGVDHGEDFEVDWSQFEEVIWPALAARVPAFERLRPGRAWAGHYDMNLFDHNALVGAVPGLANASMAAGFSGHGIQQAPAVGRALAEGIVHGRQVSLDLGALSPMRLLEGRPLLERNII